MRHWKDGGVSSAGHSPSALPSEFTRIDVSDTLAGGGMLGSSCMFNINLPTCSTRITSRGGRFLSAPAACAGAPGTNSLAAGLGGGLCTFRCSAPTPLSTQRVAGALGAAAAAGAPSAPGAPSSLPSEAEASEADASAVTGTEEPSMTSRMKTLARTLCTQSSSSSPVRVSTIGILGAATMASSSSAASPSPSPSSSSSPPLLPIELRPKLEKTEPPLRPAKGDGSAAAGEPAWGAEKMEGTEANPPPPPLAAPNPPPPDPHAPPPAPLKNPESQAASGGCGFLVCMAGMANVKGLAPSAAGAPARLVLAKGLADGLLGPEADGR
mmetsp:Transcript_40705/g.100746  ORF Transcript_40705/g.100746 Transcript_40705/m.100746 type:complete len:325 (-) Transcript_40705:328-1302(-)